MTPITRRHFVACACVAAPLPLSAQTPARVEEAGEQAVALGYRHDTTRVDQAKYPKHTAAQKCSNCSFWQGKPEEPWAGCAMFGRKQIAGPGWCAAWAAAPAK